MKFELEPYNRNVPDEYLIKDMKDVSKKTRRNTVTMAEYERYGRSHPTTLTRRFRSWFNVLENAGLQASRSKFNIPDKELFDNIKDIWIFLGRRPWYAEVKMPISKYYASTYVKRFGSWRKALEAFIEYINDDSTEEAELKSDITQEWSLGKKSKKKPRRTKREISERLRFSILLRDGFRCQSCGKSPVTTHGVELQVDHIIAWANGGETTRENLETKCNKCNLGKGNAFDK